MTSAGAITLVGAVDGTTTAVPVLLGTFAGAEEAATLLGWPEVSTTIGTAGKDELAAGADVGTTEVGALDAGIMTIPMLEVPAGKSTLSITLDAAAGRVILPGMLLAMIIVVGAVATDEMTLTAEDTPGGRTTAGTDDCAGGAVVEAGTLVPDAGAALETRESVEGAGTTEGGTETVGIITGTTTVSVLDPTADVAVTEIGTTTEGAEDTATAVELTGTMTGAVVLSGGAEEEAGGGGADEDTGGGEAEDETGGGAEEETGGGGAEEAGGGGAEETGGGAEEEAGGGAEEETGGRTSEEETGGGGAEEDGGGGGAVVEGTGITITDVGTVMTD